jgi:hypothetical protein
MFGNITHSALFCIEMVTSRNCFTYNHLSGSAAHLGFKLDYYRIWLSSWMSRLVETDRRFRGAYYFIIRAITFLKEVISISDTSVNFYETTQRSIPENNNLCTHRLRSWNLMRLLFVIIIVVVISCHRFSFFPGTSALEPVVNPTTQASSLSL